MLRIATWNLWWRFGEWERRQPVIAKELASLDADVIGLQEVWHSATENQAEILAADLGYHVAFGPSPAPEKWQRRIGDDSIGIGNAILSRWPIQVVSISRLPPGDAQDEGRIGVHATIDTPHGALPLTTTHLNSAWSQSSIRTTQLATVLEAIVSLPSAVFPPVLCGDFNATEDFDEVRSLTGKRDALVDGLVLLDGWKFTRPSEDGWTWDRRNPHVDATHEPSARIDYVFVGLATGEGFGKPTDAGLFATDPHDGVWASDHFGVWIDLASPD